MPKPKCQRRPLAQVKKSRRATVKYTQKTLNATCAYKDAHPSATYSAVAVQFGVPTSTLNDRHRKLHMPAREAHGHQQKIKPAEELAIVDWLEHLYDQGCPVDKRTVLDMVTVLTGNPTPPNKKWVHRFCKRHDEEVWLGKPGGLDPKRAQAFNRATVDDHFSKLRDIIETHNIPWSHVYNMDEKGVQRGGGRRLQNIKYFVPRDRQPRYKLRSANLELVTIVECVCADGSNLQPGFIFQGKEYSRRWFEGVDPRITYVCFPLIRT